MLARSKRAAAYSLTRGLLRKPALAQLLGARLLSLALPFSYRALTVGARACLSQPLSLLTLEPLCTRGQLA